MTSGPIAVHFTECPSHLCPHFNFWFIHNYPYPLSIICNSQLLQFSVYPSGWKKKVLPGPEFRGVSCWAGPGWYLKLANKQIQQHWNLSAKKFEGKYVKKKQKKEKNRKAPFLHHFHCVESFFQRFSALWAGIFRLIPAQLEPGWPQPFFSGPWG